MPQGRVGIIAPKDYVKEFAQGGSTSDKLPITVLRKLAALLPTDPDPVDFVNPLGIVTKGAVKSFRETASDAVHKIKSYLPSDLKTMIRKYIDNFEFDSLNHYRKEILDYLDTNPSLQQDIIDVSKKFLPGEFSAYRGRGRSVRTPFSMNYKLPDISSVRSFSLIPKNAYDFGNPGLRFGGSITKARFTPEAIRFPASSKEAEIVFDQSKAKKIHSIGPSYDIVQKRIGDKMVKVAPSIIDHKISKLIDYFKSKGIEFPPGFFEGIKKHVEGTYYDVNDIIQTMLIQYLNKERILDNMSPNEVSELLNNVSRIIPN